MDQEKAPKARILDAAARLFYKEPIHSITLDRIVAEANTTKMAFYRHYDGRDQLVRDWLQSISDRNEARWEWLAAEHPGNPIAQIMGWARFMANRLQSETNRKCPYMNTAAELAEECHPAWRVIREHTINVVEHLESLCRQAQLPEAARIARGIVYIVDGAHNNAATLDPKLVGEDMMCMIRAMIAPSKTKKPEIQ